MCVCACMYEHVCVRVRSKTLSRLCMTQTVVMMKGVIEAEQTAGRGEVEGCRDTVKKG